MIGLKREPKWGHLRDLHKAIKLCEPALVSAYPTVWSLGKNSEVSLLKLSKEFAWPSYHFSSAFSYITHFQAHEFRSKSGDCAAFLANYDTSSSAKVTYFNKQYDLPPWSISILPDCKTAIFNTAKVWNHTYVLHLYYINCCEGYWSSLEPFLLISIYYVQWNIIFIVIVKHLINFYSCIVLEIALISS